MTKNKKKGDKKLSAKNLQIEILKYLLTQPKKQFSPRQMAELLKIDAKAVAALWADAMQAYYPTGTFAPPGDRSNVRDLSSSAQWPLRSHAGDPQGRTPATAAPRPPQRRRWFWNRERNN